MKLIYQCEICGEQYSNRVGAVKCEKIPLIGDKVKVGDKIIQPNIIGGDKPYKVTEVLVISPSFAKKYGWAKDFIHHIFVHTSHVEQYSTWDGSTVAPNYKVVK